ncbi:ABC-three component system middle component 1 [Clostridium sp.]
MDLNKKHLLKLYEDMDEEHVRILHFTKELESYNANIICCGFSKKEYLRDYWKNIVNNVAMYVQAHVNSRIEAFNIYIIFFVEGVESDLLYKVEQDKYSSRKIVIDMNMPDNINEIERIIEERLFECSIETIYKKPVIERVVEKSFKNLYKYLLANEKMSIDNLDFVISIMQKDRRESNEED